MLPRKSVTAVRGALPTYFACSAAYGDFTAGLLALISVVALRNRWGLALPLAWVFSIVGTVDLVHALSHADAVPHLGTTWYIPTFFVPVLLVTHVMVFSRLVCHARQVCEAAPAAADAS